MAKTPYSFEKLIKEITDWAEPRPDMRLAIVLGSRARTVMPADEWSDLDIVFVVENPSLYLDSTDWLNNIDNVKILFLEPTAIGGGTERRVLFECGLDVDFSFLSEAQMKQEIQGKPDPGVLQIYGRGYRVLFDKDKIVPPLWQLPEVPVTLRLLTPGEFSEVANDFWYHAIWTAKKLRRGELWTALRCCDFYMKRLLLRVVECYAQIQHGGHYDTWYDGRFLERWADPHVVKGLRNAFARYSREDIKQALLATMDLFRWVTREIAGRGGYLYPVTLDEYAANLVNALLSDY